MAKSIEGASMELKYNELLFVEALAQVAEESGRPFEEALQAFAAKEPGIQAAVAAAYKFLVSELAKFRQELQKGRFSPSENGRN